MVSYGLCFAELWNWTCHDSCTDTTCRRSNKSMPPDGDIRWPLLRLSREKQREPHRKISKRIEYIQARYGKMGITCLMSQMWQDPPPLDVVVANLIEVARRWETQEATVKTRQQIVVCHLAALDAMRSRSHAMQNMVQHSLCMVKFLVASLQLHLPSFFTNADRICRTIGQKTQRIATAERIRDQLVS